MTRLILLFYATSVVALNCLITSIGAQEHLHGTQSKDQIKPPKVFLDKSPRIVKYQLDRLDNTRLLLVERADDDPKYLPVHHSILTRPGLAQQDRESALSAITAINQSDPVSELLGVITGLDDKDKEQQRIARQLGLLLLGQKKETLASQIDALVKATSSERESLRTTGFAALISSGNTEQAKELWTASASSKVAFLQAVPMISSNRIRNSLRDAVVECLTEAEPANVKGAAIDALASISTNQDKSFQQVASFVPDAKLRRSAIRTLLKIPRESRDEPTATKLAKFLVDHAEQTPAAERTSREFLEAMQLADQVLSLVSRDQSKKYRDRLNEVVVRVVLIHTVEEEMRYDIPWFAVEAGRDVQVVFRNEDLMPHNLVVTVPGALKEVAVAGAAIGPKIGESGKQYVPVLEQVLHATRMVPSEQQDVLTFKAPTEPGEYPYVCTFPGHWMRMYGVMVVVEDLAEFARNPVEPKDPIGSDRALVQAWTADDLDGKFESGLRARSAEIGKKIFAEATCAQCHIVAAEGKAVGPELTDVWSRWKGDSKGIFREIVEPSHKIEPKFIVRKVVTIDGEVISGIVMAEDNKTISILPNPESTDPTVVQQDDIEDMMTSSVSIMPKGLLDRFTEDEIMELLAYLQNADPNAEQQ